VRKKLKRKRIVRQNAQTLKGLKAGEGQRRRGTHTPAFFGKSAQPLEGKRVVKRSFGKEGSEKAEGANGKEKPRDALEQLWPIIHDPCYHKIYYLSSNE